MDRNLRAVCVRQRRHFWVGCLLELGSAYKVPRSFFFVHLLVPLAFVGASEAASTCVTGKRFLSGVRPDVGGEVIRAGETAETYVTLEWFLPSVDS